MDTRLLRRLHVRALSRLLPVGMRGEERISQMFGDRVGCLGAIQEWPGRHKLYFLRLRISVLLGFSLSQTFESLTNVVSNIFDIMLIYCETTFQDGSSDTNLVSRMFVHFSIILVRL